MRAANTRIPKPARTLFFIFQMGDLSKTMLLRYFCFTKRWINLNDAYRKEDETCSVIFMIPSFRDQDCGIESLQRDVRSEFLFLRPDLLRYGLLLKFDHRPGPKAEVCPSLLSTKICLLL